MEWKIVKHRRTEKKIGAIGFIENKIAVVATFYSDMDWNHDGRVSLKERFSGILFGLEGKALVEVLTQAKEDPEMLMRDHSLTRLQGDAIVQFASGMIIDGFYTVYFKRGIGRACGAIAAGLASNTATRFVIKKGMEYAVKEAYQATVK